MKGFFMGFMKKNLVLAAVILGGFVFGMAGSLFAVAEPVQAGVAAAVRGEVKATTPPSTASHFLKSGDKVFMGDKIETGADGQLQIMLLDQTVFTLGASGAITIDEFVYNPANDVGKVKASMLKGIFRVVSGKVAHKKSENMVVDLPAGSIGFRGTNVAGIIDGSKSTVVLLGPVGVGRIYVTNIVNGEVVAVDINEAGLATIVDGPNVAPLAVFQVSEADLNRIAAALSQQATGAETGTPGVDTGTASSPRGPVDTKALLNMLNDVDNLDQTTTLAAQNAANDSAKKEEKKDTGQSGGSGSESFSIGT
jgi:hypothetical protein